MSTCVRDFLLFQLNFRLLVTLCSLLIFTGCSHGVSTDDAPLRDRILLGSLSFDDRALESCIAGTAISSGWLYVDEVTQLHCSGRHITSLEGMQVFEHSPLSALFLLKNDITDLRPIARLNNLTELALSGNKITDTSVLRDLTKLVMLDLGGNNIEDMFPLVGLEVLLLQNNRISNVAMLYQLSQLSYVDLGSNVSIPCWQLEDLAGTLTTTSVTYGRCSG